MPRDDDRFDATTFILPHRPFGFPNAIFGIVRISEQPGQVFKKNTKNQIIIEKDCTTIDGIKPAFCSKSAKERRENTPTTTRRPRTQTTTKPTIIDRRILADIADDAPPEHFFPQTGTANNRREGFIELRDLRALPFPLARVRANHYLRKPCYL